MRTRYKNIPVKQDIYEKVKVIAEANGLGERGIGAQVEKWVARELPACDHPKTAVVIDIFPSEDIVGGTELQRHGWFCPTCNRVYQRIEKLERIESAEEQTYIPNKMRLAADPYGQPVKNKKRVQGGISK